MAISDVQLYTDTRTADTSWPDYYAADYQERVIYAWIAKVYLYLVRGWDE